MEICESGSPAARKCSSRIPESFVGVLAFVLTVYPVGPWSSTVSTELTVSVQTMKPVLGGTQTGLGQIHRSREECGAPNQFVRGDGNHQPT